MNMTFQKIAGSVIAVLAFVVAMNMIVGSLFPGLNPVVETASTSAAAPAASATATAEPAAAAAPPRPLPERLASAKADDGKAITAKCASCHSFADGGGTKVGPNLYTVFGRAKASMAGFAYSAALKALGGTWTADDLDTFLTKPSAYAPGTKMTFAGLPDGDQRAAVIAYLKSLGGK